MANRWAILAFTICMNKYSNLATAIFFTLRRRAFFCVIQDFSRPVPLRMNGLSLLVLSLRLSLTLRQYPVRRIGLALPPGIGGVVANLAVLFAGKVPVNLNLTVSQKSMAATLREAEITIIVSAEKVRKKFPDFPWTESFVDIGKFLQDEKSRKANLFFLAIKSLFVPGIIFRKFKLEQIPNQRKEAVLLFTSGSSSQPKGVVLSDQNILSNCDQMNSLGLFKKEMSILGNLPLFHSFGLTVGTFFPLLYGLRIISAPSPLDYKNSLRAIRDGRVEVLLGTPTFLKGYVRKGTATEFQTVRYVVAGAEKSPVELIHLWENEYDCEYLEGYGLTETSPGLSFNLPGDGKRSGSVGRLMKGIESRTIDAESGEVLNKETQGILCFRGPNVFEGYLNNEEKSNEVFSEDGWFISGDLGRVDDDGFLFIEGRLSRFSKIGGEMVPHESVEGEVAKILASEDDSEGEILCAVTGIADDMKGESLVLLTTQKLDQRWIAVQLRQRGVPNLWIPKKTRQIQEIPLLGTGKLDLRKIKELALG